MARNARFQRRKKQVLTWAQGRRDGLVRIGAKGIAWVRRSAFTILQATWNKVQRAANYLRRHSSFCWVGIGLIVFILILWILPEWQVAGATFTSDKDRLELVDKIRGTLAQIGAGIGIALGLYFTWRRVAAAERTVQVAQEGQITERFTRAIDQLGATERLEIRLGGIYALERIARDSEKDHWPIMEVLTAYVREHAPWNEGSQLQPKQPQDPAALSSENATQQQEPRVSPAPDIQAILTVLGRRTRWFGKGENQHLDLHGTDMRGANLSEAHLEAALLHEAHLEAALLRRAHLQGAHLGLAHLQRAFLSRAHLEGASLVRAHLERADLRGAHLDGAHLNEADLSKAHLQGVDLRKTHGLTREQLAVAYTEGALLPDYLTSSQAADGEDA